MMESNLKREHDSNGSVPENTVTVDGSGAEDGKAWCLEPWHPGEGAASSFSSVDAKPGESWAFTWLLQRSTVAISFRESICFHGLLKQPGRREKYPVIMLIRLPFQNNFLLICSVSIMWWSRSEYVKRLCDIYCFPISSKNLVCRKLKVKYKFSS